MAGFVDYGYGLVLDLKSWFKSPVGWLYRVIRLTRRRTFISWSRLVSIINGSDIYIDKHSKHCQY